VSVAPNAVSIHQENHITCGMCGTMLLMQTTHSHTPTNNGGDVILVVAIHLPQIICGTTNLSQFIIMSLWGHNLKREWVSKTDKGDTKKRKFPEKKQMEEANEGEEPDMDNDEHIVFAIEESEPPKFMFDTSEEGQVFNFDNSYVNSSDEFDQCLIFYNWLADSATTSHICN